MIMPASTFDSCVLRRQQQAHVGGHADEAAERDAVDEHHDPGIALAGARARYLRGSTASATAAPSTGSSNWPAFPCRTIRRSPTAPGPSHSAATPRSRRTRAPRCRSSRCDPPPRAARPPRSAPAAAAPPRWHAASRSAARGRETESRPPRRRYCRRRRAPAPSLARAADSCCPPSAARWQSSRRPRRAGRRARAARCRSARREAASIRAGIAESDDAEQREPPAVDGLKQSCRASRARWRR